MQPERHGALALDRCTACAGLWFDRDELNTYLRTLPPPEGSLATRPTLVPDAEPLPCPRCQIETLRSYRAATVLLSRCSACEGVYLDGDDVRALRGARPRYQPDPEAAVRRGSDTGAVAAGMAGEVLVETVLMAGVRAGLAVLKGL